MARSSPAPGHRRQLCTAPRAFVAWAADSIERIGKGTGVQSMAVGVPGPVDQHKGVLVNPPNLPGWKNVPLVEMLEAAVRAPVYLENGANLAGLGEFSAGEVGHLILDPDGPLDSCDHPTLMEILRSSPFIKPARRPRVRRARLGDRAGQVGAIEWARKQLRPAVEASRRRV